MPSDSDRNVQARLTVYSVLLERTFNELNVYRFLVHALAHENPSLNLEHFLVECRKNQALAAHTREQLAQLRELLDGVNPTPLEEALAVFEKWIPRDGQVN
jgi:hypothetical protein